MHDMTAFQRDALFALAAGETHGLGLKARLEGYHPTVTTGRLYQSLGELVDDGFVAKEPVDGRTNAYALTAAGREAVEDRLAWTQAQVNGDG